MIYKVVCARDKLVGFGAPMLEANLEVAKRSFASAMARQDAAIVGDIDLYCIGDFDSNSGHVEPCVPTFIASGSDFLKEAPDA